MSFGAQDTAVLASRIHIPALDRPPTPPHLAMKAVDGSQGVNLNGRPPIPQAMRPDTSSTTTSSRASYVTDAEREAGSRQTSVNSEGKDDLSRPPTVEQDSTFLDEQFAGLAVGARPLGEMINGLPVPPAPTSAPPPPPPNKAPPPPPIVDRSSTSLSMHRLSGASTTTPAPGPGGLRQRHTLEVPRGEDSATASGRFSPAAVPAASKRTSTTLPRRNTRSVHSDMPRDDAVPDDDARRWAEAVRQKRASKRRRKDDVDDDDRVIVGTKVDEKHANWVTAYNMLTGIRVSVSRTNAKLDRALTDADFDAKQKSTFDIAGNELVPSAKYDFKFKDYAPWVFRHLRTIFNLDPADYLMSLTGKYILSELGSPGKSGSFFYFSRDYKYIIKTIHHSEHKFLRRILKRYHEHVMANPNTLLSQFYGLHRVKTPMGKKIHFVVMNNIFPPHRDIHQTFDLKGSTIGRDYNEDDLQNNPRATLKDLNWMRRKRHLELGMQKRQLFLDQLSRDVALLKELHIMDYSLLVGIHDLQKGNDEKVRDQTLKVFNPGGEATAADDMDGASVLLRTPSKMENARKARELRHMLHQERPVPLTEGSPMPDELDDARPGLFNQDEGGFRATHENGMPGDEVYYIGVIDCLTHFGFLKKMEHFWKSLHNDRAKISAMPPQDYGDRFFRFVERQTMSPERAAEFEQAEQELADQEAEASHTLAANAA